MKLFDTDQGERPITTVGSISGQGEQIEGRQMKKQNQSGGSVLRENHEGAAIRAS